MAKRALVIGITGQDGSYLAELLLSKGYKVYGLRRRTSSFFATQRIDHLLNDFRHDQDARLFLEYGDLADATSLVKLIYRLQPDEIYNLGAQSHVHVSFEMPAAFYNPFAIIGSILPLAAVISVVEMGLRGSQSPDQ